MKHSIYYYTSFAGLPKRKMLSSAAMAFPLVETAFDIYGIYGDSPKPFKKEFAIARHTNIDSRCSVCNALYTPVGYKNACC